MHCCIFEACLDLSLFVHLLLDVSVVRFSFLAERSPILGDRD